MVLKLLPLKHVHIKHLQNKEKGGLGVLREHGHNEDEDAANEDPGVNSDNEEEDEFKVDKLLSIHQMQFHQRPNLIPRIVHPIHNLTHLLLSPV